MSSNHIFLDPKTGVALHNAAERQVDVASILIEAAVELRKAGGLQSKAAAKRLAEMLDVAATALDRSSKITKSGAGQVGGLGRHTPSSASKWRSCALLAHSVPHLKT
jgi:deoxyribose-phosphate aldolase